MDIGGREVVNMCAGGHVSYLSNFSNIVRQFDVRTRSVDINCYICVKPLQRDSC